MIEYLIVCPLVFLAGFIDAIAGGGGLISLPAYLIAGLPPHAAIGLELLRDFARNVASFRKNSKNLEKKTCIYLKFC